MPFPAKAGRLWLGNGSIKPRTSGLMGVTGSFTAGREVRFGVGMKFNMPVVVWKVGLEGLGEFRCWLFASIGKLDAGRAAGIGGSKGLVNAYSPSKGDGGMSGMTKKFGSVE